MAIDLPPNAVQYMPVLVAEVKSHWPGVPVPYALAAQVEQETCSSLKSRKCWNPQAELKTAREYGFGLGQLTVTSRFDNFKEAKKLHSSLADWKWENRYNPAYQLRTMVLMDKFAFNKISWASDDYERQAMSFAAYNGGLGGLLSDRTVCRATEGCDPTRWFGHIENTSKKSKAKYKGYGKSFFEINREYVVNIMTVRLTKYIEMMRRLLCSG